MKNIMFDVAATIESENSFEDLTTLELVTAVRKRLDQILADDDSGAFGFSDEYEIPK